MDKNSEKKSIFLVFFYELIYSPFFFAFGLKLHSKYTFWLRNIGWPASFQIYLSNIENYTLWKKMFRLKFDISYLIKVAFPVKGPNLISPNGGLNPSMFSASSWLRGCKLEDSARKTIIPK